MRLTTAQLAQVLLLLDKIDRGGAHPRAPGRIGRFFRQYRHGRLLLDNVLRERGAERRADGAVSGRGLGTIEIHPLLKPEVSLLDFPLQEVADTLAISEELGGLTYLVMWLKGHVANSAYNMLRGNSGLQLDGDYRWTPPARLTPGEAQLDVSESSIGWQDARCLKAVADDLLRPPHALEYVLDYRMGRPGLKYFRSVCAVTHDEGWEVLPALERSRPLEIAENSSGTLARVATSSLAALLIYREPWSGAWNIVSAEPIEEKQVLAHAVAWASFQRELAGSEIDGETIAGIRDSLRVSGLRTPDFTQANLAQSLLPVARHVLRWLRNSS